MSRIEPPGAPEIGFSALSGPELKRLCDAAEARGDALLAQRVRLEMDARKRKTPAEAASFEGAEPLAHPRAEVAPPPWREAAYEPKDRGDEGRGAALILLGAGAVAGGLLTAVAFLALGAPDRPPPPPQPRAMTALAPPPRPPAQITIVPPIADPPPVAEQEDAEEAQAPAPKVERRAQVRRTSASSRRPPARAAPCAIGSAADRMVCGDPQLTRLAHDLADAQGRALNAHASPAALDSAEFRRAREAAKGRDELAAVYMRRIRELDAAAREAREREPIY